MSKPNYVYRQEFEVAQVTPDPRQYNQQRQIFKCVDALIVVELDINKENFYLPNNFFENLKLAELGQGDWPDVPSHLFFTPLGWSRIMEQLEAPYQELEPQNEDWDDEEFSDEY